MLFSLIVNGQSLTSIHSDASVPWWSFTKTVLAATSLSLVQDGLLGLDDKVMGEAFTLRQLLRHEAGLSDYREHADYQTAVEERQRAWPTAEMLRRVNAAKLRYEPGTSWYYSNVGYMFIARLIEQATGLTLERAIITRALAPLGLSGVRIASHPSDLDETYAGNASYYDPAWVYHGLLIGPLSQAALFLDRLLDGHLISHSLLKQMRTIRWLGGPLPGQPWLTPGYGLGVMQSATDRGHILCGHTGSGPGSSVAIYRCAEKNASVCCAISQQGTGRGEIEARVVQCIASNLQQLLTER